MISDRKHQRTIVERATDDFLRHLRERNASAHTIKAYAGDLDNFAAYIGPRDWKAIDHIAVRGFLSHLYDKGLSKTSVARALAAVRSLYRWLAQEGVVEQNPAKLVSTPRLAKKLPRVPTIEEMNSMLDGKMPEVASFPERDRLMFELLYGCGLRNSELVGINLDDISLSNAAILIRGKGKKERYVPFGGSALAALAVYLPWRQQLLATLKNTPKKLVSRKAYPRKARPRCSSTSAADGSPRAVWDASSSGSRLPRECRPKSIRTRCVTPSARTCWRREPTCAPSRNCSATSAWRLRNATHSSRSST